MYNQFSQRHVLKIHPFSSTLQIIYNRYPYIHAATSGLLILVKWSVFYPSANSHVLVELVRGKEMWDLHRSNNSKTDK